MMRLLEALKFTHDHHDVIAEAVHKLTADQIVEAGDVAAGRKPVGDVKGNPLIDLLIGLISDPTKLSGLLQLIMTIISLIPKKP